MTDKKEKTEADKVSEGWITVIVICLGVVIVCTIMGYGASAIAWAILVRVGFTCWQHDDDLLNK